MRIIPKTVTVIGATLALLASACSANGSPAPDGRLKVVASFYPLAEAASQVGGDLVDVQDLTPAGTEPHDLELTPSQYEDLTTADVVVYLGGGFQPAVEQAIADATGVVVDASEGIDRLSGDAAEMTDPHVWLDPVLYGKLVTRVSEAMQKADPSHRDQYRSGAASFGSSLRQLDSDYRTGLASCDRDEVVTTHAMLGYAASRYGFVQIPIVGISPESEASPARLALLEEKIRRDGITTIFTDPLSSSRVAETLATESGAATAVFDPLESLTQDRLDQGADYLSVMRENLSALEDALGCH